jgi:plastocyanin
MKTIFTFSRKILSGGFLPTLLILLFNSWAFSQNLHIVEVRNDQFDPAELVINTGDTVEWRNVQGFHNVNGTQTTYASNPESFGNEPGENWTFRHIFTLPGSYDYQCDPHAALGMVGNIIVQEGNGVEDFMLTVVFSGMNPHVGQDFWLAVIDKNSGMEVGRVHTTAEVDFSVQVAGIEPGSSYNVDFWADHNGNGVYDAPPTDHAWRLELDDVEGDATLMFAHNTDFTDIMWRNKLTVELSGMNPHIGQMFALYVVNANDGAIQDTVIIEEITEADFTVNSYNIMPGNSYYINFFADFNGNGMYDAPPVDHAWQLMLENVAGDTTLTFVHNTDFTDIFPVTSVTLASQERFNMYPNPATDKVWIEMANVSPEGYSVSVFNISGKLSGIKTRTLNNRIELDINHLQKGIYFVELKSASYKKTIKLIKD